MRHAITDEALAFVACFSTGSMSSGPSRQNEEITLAIEQLRERPPGEPWLIPVRLDDCLIHDWDIGAGRTLRSIRPADLFGDAAEEETERLVTSIRRILDAVDHRTEAAVGPATASRPDSSPVGKATVSMDGQVGQGRPVRRRIMSWDVAIRAAWIGGICVIVGAIIALIPSLLDDTHSRSPNRGQHSTGTGPATPPRTWPEKTFTDSRTFANYVNAGDPAGARLKTGQTVRVSCRVRGFKVKDGDRWWYRLASHPWNGRYYATSDVFYNTRNTSGSPINGVAVDKRVPVC